MKAAVTPTLTDRAYWERVPTIRELDADRASTFQPLFDRWLPHGTGREAIEIGAYPGVHLAALSRSHDYRPVAVDFLPRVHELGPAFQRAGFPAVETIQADFLEWNSSRLFAVVMSFGFIEHFADPGVVLRRHWDLVEPGGYLVVGTPLFGPWQWRLRMCIYDAANRKATYATHNVEAMRPGALERFCAELPEAEPIFAGPYGYMDTWFGFRDPYVRALGIPAIAIWKAVAWLPRLLGKSSYKFSPYAIMVVRKQCGRGLEHNGDAGWADQVREGGMKRPSGMTLATAARVRLHGIVCTAGNLLREFRANPLRLWRHSHSPWARLEGSRQFDALLARYPASPIDSAGCRIGVLKDFGQHYCRYEKACRELAVDHRVIDLTAPDWLSAVRTSGCDGFIAHPDPYTLPWKTLFDERLRILHVDLGYPVHPDLNALWFYESKRRMAYWLEANAVAHPGTRVFYDRKAAFAFAAGAAYPMICKTDLGSSAGGVVLLRRRGQAFRLIARAFGAGLLGRGRDPRDREWGFILFQQYCAGVREFRIIQIGDSWFGYEKLTSRQDGFHSGSGKTSLTLPPEKVFDLAREVSLKGGFTAMSYDVFMCPDGTVLVNELQVMFYAYNPSQMYHEGIPGRMRHDGTGWRFEEGLYCRNGCANLRIAELVGRLRATKSTVGSRSPAEPRVQESAFHNRDNLA